MKPGFFKVRRNAIIVTIVVILLASLFGVNRSLGQKVREVSDYFNEGVFSEKDGYRLKSIRSQLNVRAEASINILTVSVKYDEAAEESTQLRNARNKLMDLLESDSSPSKLYTANKNLDEAFNKLYAKLDTLELTETDRENIKRDNSRMTGAASMIEKSKYNETVRDFNRSVLSVFPVNFLREICFVPAPELFD